MTINFKNIRLTLCLLALLTPTLGSAQTQAEFEIWLNEFKEQALQKGISQGTLDQAFTDLTLNEKVLELDRRQPEFTLYSQFMMRDVT